MTWPDDTESRFREEGEREWALNQVKALQKRLKELLAAHDRCDLNLGDEADTLRKELYGIHDDGFDQPKSVAVVIAPNGDRGCWAGPLLNDDILEHEPDFPPDFRCYIERGTPGGMVRTHRWHEKRGKWIALKSHTK